MRSLFFNVLAIFFTFIFFLTPAFGISLETKAPQINIKDYTTTIAGEPITISLSEFSNGLNTTIGLTFKNVTKVANDQLEPFNEFKQLASGFANANLYTSRVAGHQTYQDYSIFALTTGFAIGVQAPSIDANYYKKIAENINKDGDIKAGIGAGLAFFNLGINLNLLPVSFLKGFYANFKYGSFGNEDLNSILDSAGGIDLGDKLDIEFKTIGLGVNYSFITSKNLLLGFFKWRGISFGSGLIMNRNNINLSINLKDTSPAVSSALNQPYAMSQTIPIADGLTDLTIAARGGIEVDPSFTAGINTTTYTIPLDVNTSFRILWLFDLSLGGGVDLNFGSTDIILFAGTDVKIGDGENAFELDMSLGGQKVVDSELNNLVTFTPGSAVLDWSTKNNSPSFVSPRVNGGLGFALGPIKLELPITWYLMKGLSLGLTAGLVW